ncbi:unnamed protein product [Bursaphelenchus okinawaensis]|uniref:Uncharacterized protein n=1 Tax=Bursaphelenchus okinawaensis TaxID=465554 RepID=A0A811K246_9BILA|nr:unnamed protein product [Bursaphelenchus okinawaensis]CAG9089481.1 unnamed protein product [Bursaphelenchus okinawaensis]
MNPQDAKNGGATPNDSELYFNQDLNGLSLARAPQGNTDLRTARSFSAHRLQTACSRSRSNSRTNVAPQNQASPSDEVLKRQNLTQDDLKELLQALLAKLGFEHLNGEIVCKKCGQRLHSHMEDPAPVSKMNLGAPRQSRLVGRGQPVGRGGQPVGRGGQPQGQGQPTQHGQVNYGPFDPVGQDGQPACQEPYGRIDPLEAELLTARLLGSVTELGTAKAQSLDNLGTAKSASATRLGQDIRTARGRTPQQLDQGQYSDVTTARLLASLTQLETAKCPSYYALDGPAGQSQYGQDLATARQMPSDSQLGTASSRSKTNLSQDGSSQPQGHGQVGSFQPYQQDQGGLPQQGQLGQGGLPQGQYAQLRTARSRSRTGLGQGSQDLSTARPMPSDSQLGTARSRSKTNLSQDEAGQPQGHGQVGSFQPQDHYGPLTTHQAELLTARLLSSNSELRTAKAQSLDYLGTAKSASGTQQPSLGQGGLQLGQQGQDLRTARGQTPGQLGQGQGLRTARSRSRSNLSQDGAGQPQSHGQGGQPQGYHPGRYSDLTIARPMPSDSQLGTARSRSRTSLGGLPQGSQPGQYAQLSGQDQYGGMTPQEIELLTARIMDSYSQMKTAKAQSLDNLGTAKTASGTNQPGLMPQLGQGGFQPGQHGQDLRTARSQTPGRLGQGQGLRTARSLSRSSLSRDGAGQPQGHGQGGQGYHPGRYSDLTTARLMPSDSQLGTARNPSYYDVLENSKPGQDLATARAMPSDSQLGTARSRSRTNLSQSGAAQPQGHGGQPQHAQPGQHQPPFGKTPFDQHAIGQDHPDKLQTAKSAPSASNLATAKAKSPMAASQKSTKSKRKSRKSKSKNKSKSKKSNRLVKDHRKKPESVEMDSKVLGQDLKTARQAASSTQLATARSRSQSRLGHSQLAPSHLIDQELKTGRQASSTQLATARSRSQSRLSQQGQYGQPQYEEFRQQGQQQPLFGPSAAQPVARRRSTSHTRTALDNELSKDVATAVLPSYTDQLSEQLATAKEKASATHLATARGQASGTYLSTARGQSSASHLATARGQGSATGLATARGQASELATARGQGSAAYLATARGQASATDVATARARSARRAPSFSEQGPNGPLDQGASPYDQGPSGPYEQGPNAPSQLGQAPSEPFRGRRAPSLSRGPLSSGRGPSSRGAPKRPLSQGPKDQLNQFMKDKNLTPNDLKALFQMPAFLALLAKLGFVHPKNDIICNQCKQKLCIQAAAAAQDSQTTETALDCESSKDVQTAQYPSTREEHQLIQNLNELNAVCVDTATQALGGQNNTANRYSGVQDQRVHQDHSSSRTTRKSGSFN